MTVLNVENLSVRQGSRMLCSDLSLTLSGGEVTGVLGRNGIGKSSLLYTIMGFRPRETGSIQVQGNDVRNLTRRQLARSMGMLFQESDYSMPSTVLELALLGRHPHTENLLWDGPEDHAIAREILSLTGLADFERRQVVSLSGGEKQRLAIALVMIQDPGLFLLDEPSNHLDVDYQIRLLTLLAERIRDRRQAILMASHDINLIARFCDRILLMLEAGEWIAGPVAEILNEANLSRAFGCGFVRIEHDGHYYFLPGR